MCGSMVDIQYASAENRRGKKKKEEETTGRKYNGLPYSVGRPLQVVKIIWQKAASPHSRSSASFTMHAYLHRGQEMIKKSSLVTFRWGCRKKNL